MPNIFSRKWFLRHIKYLISVIIVWSIYTVIGIGCPIYAIFGIRCPACGTTRALISLLSGNLELYFKLNPFAILLIVSLLIGIHLSVMPKKQNKYATVVIIIIAIFNFCWYICTLVQS